MPAPDKLYQEVMPRGAAVRVGREMGYADGSFPRRWRRALGNPNNLFSGELSPWMRAKVELLAQDRADHARNGQAADLLLWDAIYDVARQRSRTRPETRETIILNLTKGFYSAIKAITLNLSRDVLEMELYRLGATVIHALIWLVGDDGAVDGVPLRMVDETPHIFVRVWRALRRRW